MSDADSTTSTPFQEYAGQWFDRLVKGVAGVYGNKAADAVDLTPDEEVDLYRRPTSPAALKAYELGGSDDDAERANRLWGHAMRGQQAMIRQQMQQAGAAPEQIAEALGQQGLTDNQIFATCRKYAHKLGRDNSHNDPKQEVEYHKRMAPRVAQRRGTTLSPQIMTVEEGA